jgi:ribosome-associated protein
MSSFKIPEDEFQLSFSRSSGAGGQNVNKVNTKATLEWNLAESSVLPADVAQRFREKFAHRMVGDIVQVRSQRFREQARNIADCIEKLHEMIEEVAVPPKKRKPTKPKKSAVEQRLQDKKRQSEKKRLRQEY